MFLDEAIVEFASGRGGAGAVSFHTEKHVPRGRPNGADGGKGGDVVLVADRSKRTLYDFKFKSRFEAESGSKAVSNKSGRNAPDLVIRVPVGTVVFDDETGEQIVDLAYDGARFILCKGGRGGFGNEHYVSSVRQAPKVAQKGEPEERLRARLELKLVADVGIIGLPNAGKSTLISTISASKAKVADYPFTTIEPNLGVVSVGDETFTVADMPGLIEGASQGAGLGHQFLRHVERTSVLVHLVEALPIDESDPIENFRLIERELDAYSKELANRPRIVCLSKVDVAGEPVVHSLVDRFKTIGVEVLPISSATGYNIDQLLFKLLEVVRLAATSTPVPVLLPLSSRKTDDSSWEVKRTDGYWEVAGKRIEKLIAMTDLENWEAVRQLHRKLQRIGVIEKLRDAGVQHGDEVIMGDYVFMFEDDR